MMGKAPSPHLNTKQKQRTLQLFLPWRCSDKAQRLAQQDMFVLPAPFHHQPVGFRFFLLNINHLTDTDIRIIQIRFLLKNLKRQN